MVIGLSLLTTLLAFLIFNHFRNSPAIDCHSNVRVFNSEGEIQVLFSYSMKNGSGVANVSGTFYGQESVTGSISRTVTFNYKKSNNIYTLHSTNVAQSSLDKFDNEFLNHYLPKFYLYKDVPLIITVTPQTQRGWVFSTGKVPSFYCENNH